MAFYKIKWLLNNLLFLFINRFRLLFLILVFGIFIYFLKFIPTYPKMREKKHRPSLYSALPQVPVDNYPIPYFLK